MWYGRRRKPQNLWYGLSGLNLPYVANEFTPNLGEIYTDTTSWYSTGSYNTGVQQKNTTASRLTMGYDRVKAYHTDISNEAEPPIIILTEKSRDRFDRICSTIQENDKTRGIERHVNTHALIEMKPESEDRVERPRKKSWESAKKNYS